MSNLTRIILCVGALHVVVLSILHEMSRTDINQHRATKPTAQNSMSQRSTHVAPRDRIHQTTPNSLPLVKIPHIYSDGLPASFNIAAVIPNPRSGSAARQVASVPQRRMFRPTTQKRRQMQKRYIASRPRSPAQWRRQERRLVYASPAGSAYNPPQVISQSATYVPRQRVSRVKALGIKIKGFFSRIKQKVM
jgi:hypothetical protein